MYILLYLLNVVPCEYITYSLKFHFNSTTVIHIVLTEASEDIFSKEKQRAKD